LSTWPENAQSVEVPFRRQIIAQALSEEIPVMTCDEKFSLYKGLKVLW
jgi:PIN domain nuclease of toxin-antitoxin system